jgi:hypothetical protein
VGEWRDLSPTPPVTCRVEVIFNGEYPLAPATDQVHGLHRGDVAKLHGLSIADELHNLLTP